MRTVKVGNLIFGGEKIIVQSMTNVPTSDRDALFSQSKRLIDGGCDLVRVAVSSETEAKICAEVFEKLNAPVCADIQYDSRLAVLCSDLGYAKVRINPGNIGDESRVAEVVAACKANGTVLRVGANSGSLHKDIIVRYGKTAEAMVESVRQNLEILERLGFYDTVVSLKSSSVALTVEANRLFRRKYDYPLHLGVTESGIGEQALIKSAVGIGSLLLDGIGETIRVSLSGDPIYEIRTAKEILRSIGKDKNYCEIISCPTCSRCNYDLAAFAEKLRQKTENIRKPLKVAVMGCAVNGIGEAGDADMGIAGGKDGALIFASGKIIKKTSFDEAYKILLEMITEYADE